MNRLPSIVALLALAILTSCEPSQDSVGVGGVIPSDADGEMGSRIRRDTSNPERIAAQNSVGRPPLPRNLVNDVEDVCPVHREKMKVREIPIVYSESTLGKVDPSEIQSRADFPFGAEKLISSGNALLPGEPLSAYVYQCAACVAAREAAEVKSTSAALR